MQPVASVFSNGLWHLVFWKTFVYTNAEIAPWLTLSLFSVTLPSSEPLVLRLVILFLHFTVEPHHSSSHQQSVAQKIRSQSKKKCMTINPKTMCYLLQHCLRCKADNLTDWTGFIYRQTAIQLLLQRVFFFFFLSKPANELAHRSLWSVFFPTLRKEGLLFNMENGTLYSQCKYQCDVAAMVSWGWALCCEVISLVFWWYCCKLHNPLGSCLAQWICSESEREGARAFNL